MRFTIASGLLMLSNLLLVSPVAGSPTPNTISTRDLNAERALCPLMQQCGKTCCAPGESCKNGACCASGKACGSTCCSTTILGAGDLFTFERFCASATRSLCCYSKTDFVCGGKCCPEGMRCMRGQCVQPLKKPEECINETSPKGQSCQNYADCTPDSNHTAGCSNGCCFFYEIPR